MEETLTEAAVRKEQELKIIIVRDVDERSASRLFQHYCSIPLVPEREREPDMAIVLDFFVPESLRSSSKGRTPELEAAATGEITSALGILESVAGRVVYLRPGGEPNKELAKLGSRLTSTSRNMDGQALLLMPGLLAAGHVETSDRSGGQSSYSRLQAASEAALRVGGSESSAVLISHVSRYAGAALHPFWEGTAAKAANVVLHAYALEKADEKDPDGSVHEGGVGASALSPGSLRRGYYGVATLRRQGPAAAAVAADGGGGGRWYTEAVELRRLPGAQEEFD